MSTNLKKNLRTLADDLKIIEAVKKHVDELEKNIGEVGERLETLSNSVDECQIRFDDAHNRIDLLKSTKYVKEVIEDDGFDVKPVKGSQKLFGDSSELEASLLSQLKDACSSGICLVDQRFKEIEVHVPQSSFKAASKVFEPLNPHLLRELPALLGSTEFFAWDLHQSFQSPTDVTEVVVQKAAVPGERPFAIPDTVQVPDTVNTSFQPEPHINDEFDGKLLDMFGDDEDSNADSNELSSQTSEPKIASSDQNAKLLQEEIKSVLAAGRQEKSDRTSGPEDRDSQNEPVPLLVEKPVGTNPSTDIPKNDHMPNTTKKPTRSSVPQPAVTHSIFSEDSDDSLDQLLVRPSTTRVAPTQTLTSDTAVKSEFPRSLPQPAPVTSSLTSQITKTSVTKAASARPREEIQKNVRSLFDSSSDSDDLFPSKPVLTASKVKTTSSSRTNIFSDSEDELQVTAREPSEEHEKPVQVDEPLQRVATSGESLQEAKSEMPKTVLNSVSNDFSNKLNAALLNKKQPLPAFLPKPKEPDQLSTKSTSSRSSAGSSRAEPVDSGPGQSVAALRNRLGDSLTKIHGARAGIAPKKESAEPKPTKTEDPALNFNAVKSRPRPGGRRPPSTATVNSSNTTTARPPSSPSTTTPSTVSKPSSSPSAKASTVTSTSKQVRSLFESDSDDPF